MSYTWDVDFWDDPSDQNSTESPWLAETRQYWESCSEKIFWGLITVNFLGCLTLLIAYLNGWVA